jgi:hypothetical protein
MALKRNASLAPNAVGQMHVKLTLLFNTAAQKKLGPQMWAEPKLKTRIVAAHSVALAASPIVTSRSV